MVFANFFKIIANAWSKQAVFTLRFLQSFTYLCPIKATPSTL